MHLKPLLFIAGVALLTPSVLFAGPIVFQQNFDSLTPQLSVTSAGNFTAINGTNVDIVGAANGYAGLCTGPESGNCMDLGGTGGDSLGDLKSSGIALAPGTYDLSFDLIGSERSGYGTTSTTVSLGAAGAPGQLYDQSFNSLAYNDVTSGVVNTQFTVGSAETVYLAFDLTATGNSDVGSLVDNVAISTVTPEPSSLLLFGTGFMALAGFSRRKIVADLCKVLHR